MTITNFLAPDLWLREDGGPRYLQLRQRISDSVDQAVLSPGKPLPPEREIATITTLSRVTVRKAIQALVKDGLIIQNPNCSYWVE